MIVLRLPTYLFAVVLCTSIAGLAGSQELSNYRIADEQLDVRLLDSSENESFLSVSVDSERQVFVGGREVVLVYEPDASGRYRKPVELYRFPKDSWVYDIAFRGDDLYVSTVTTLYVIPGGRKQREQLKAKAILWGMPVGSYPDPTYGVHQGMHGLAWGPQGNLYISFGDPLWYYGDFNRPDHWGHWYFYLADGSKHPYNGVGGIARIRPDGSGFQVHATGLRNPCGLAFDDRWSLFSHDNDHEQRPDLYVPGRLLHVSRGADFCWPRGWMVSKSPERKDLLQTMYDGMRRTVPVGQSYYGDTRLPDRYHDTILLARWGQRSLTSYRKWSNGASYRAKEQMLFTCEGDARPVGVAVGPQGRIFVAVCYMSHNEKSPVYRSDLVIIDAKGKTLAEDSPAVNLAACDDETLMEFLNNPGWQLRQGAHMELLERGESSLGRVADVFSKLDFDALEESFAAHAIPLIAAAESDQALGVLKSLVRHPRADIRLHAIRSLSELSADSVPQQLFVDRLTDESAPVQLVAIEALHKYQVVPAQVLDELACSTDSYLRQAAVRLMAANLSAAELETVLNSAEDKRRLAAVLALGRQLTIPSMDFIPSEELPLADTVGPQIYLDRELIDLRDSARIGNYTTVEYWKTERASLDKQFQLLLGALEDPDESVRVHAAYFLSLLNDADIEPRIRRVREGATDGRLANAESVPVAAAWFCGPFADGRDGIDRQHGPELAAIDLSAKFEQDGRTRSWQELEQPNGDFGRLIKPASSRSSYYATFQVQSASQQRIWLMLKSRGVGAVWHNGRSIWHQHRESKKKAPEDRVVVKLEPGTNTFLVRVQVAPYKQAIAFHLRSLEKIVVSTQAAPDSSLANRLQQASSTSTAMDLSPFMRVDWNNEVASGDIDQGKKLFRSIGCVKCHSISSDVPVSGGPSLADAGKRFTVDYLVESILLPNNKVSEFFRNTIVVTSAGRSFSGVVTSDTTEEIELLQSDGERIRISKEDIEEKRDSELSPMPSGLVKTTQELRDLLSYLVADESSSD